MFNSTTETVRQARGFKLYGAASRLLTLSVFLTPAAAFAQTGGGGGTGGTNMMSALGNVLTIIQAIGYLIGVIGMIMGGFMIYQGDTSRGKFALIGGVIVSSATLVMSTLYGSFGMTQGTLKAGAGF